MALPGVVAVAAKSGAAGRLLSAGRPVWILLGALVLTPVMVFACVLVLYGNLVAGYAQERQGGSNPGLVSDYQAGSCAPACPGVNGLQAGDVNVTLQAALSEVGHSFATGWSAPGECIMAVKRWLAAAGVTNNGGGSGPYGLYPGAAVLVTDGSLRPGDVVQLTNIVNPNSWGDGVHTYMILRVHDNGRFDLIQSNVPYGSGLVTVKTDMDLSAYVKPGWRPLVWRFFI